MVSSLPDIRALRTAIPYIRAYEGKVFVVKLGGRLCDPGPTLDNVVEQLSLLATLGIRVVVVHGGGEQVTQLCDRMGIQPQFVAGRRITAVDVDPGTLGLLAGGVPLEALQAVLVGRTVTGVGRRGKYLLFGLDDGRTFVAHLRMTGRIVWRDSAAPPEPYERARLTLDDGHDLRWSDLRKFGTWRVVDDPAPFVQDNRIRMRTTIRTRRCWWRSGS